MQNRFGSLYLFAKGIGDQHVYMNVRGPITREAPPEPPPVPKIVKFTASPDYIDVGKSSTLSWQVTDCKNCKVTLEGRDGLNYSDFLVTLHVTTSDSKDVAPNRSNPTRYSLIARGSNGSVGPEYVYVYLHNPGTPTPTPSGSFYYFKCINATSLRPCYTVSFFDSNEDKAKERACEVGYASSKITDAETSTACQVCGDSICDVWEDEQSCPKDCKKP